MVYLMKSGVLYDEDRTVLAKVRRSFHGAESTIVTPDGALALLARIAGARETEREYQLVEESGRVIVSGRPGYAPGEDPAVSGCPVNRFPRVDHAAVDWKGREYRLDMQDSRTYRMTSSDGGEVLRILHRGVTGGWKLETAEDVSPAVLCGLFLFSHYLALENEFVTV